MKKKIQTGSNSQSLLGGATILASSVIIVKIIGMLFKIPINSMLGGTGTGCFNAAYDLYGPIESLANAGFPVAISKMVSDYCAKGRYRDTRQLHKVSIPMFICTGMIAFFAMICLAPIYAKATNAPRIIYATFVLAPTVFFVCMMSIYKGYYQGLSNMIPTAKSEIVEAFSKLIIGVGTVTLLVKLGKSILNFNSEELAKYGAAMAILGVTCGAFIGFLYILSWHKKHGDGITIEQLKSSPKPFSSKTTIKKLIKIALPIGLAAITMNIGGLVDATLVQRRLGNIMHSDAGKIILDMYSGHIPIDTRIDEINSYLYGCLGYVTTFTLLVPSITQMLGVSALPQVSAAWARKDSTLLKKHIETVIRIAAMVTILSGITFIFFGSDILRMFYPRKTCEVYVGSQIIVLLSIAMMFTAMSTPVFSMLQAVGLLNVPLKLLSIGIIIKIICNYTLVGIPQINIQGAGAGNLICYIFVTTAAIYHLCKRTKIVPNFVIILLKPILSAFAAVSCGKFVQFLLSNLGFYISSIVSLCVVAILYFVFMLLIGGIRKFDILMFPKGENLMKVLAKFKWIR